MGAIERHTAMLASWQLRKKLSRNNPGVFIYGGIAVEEPHTLLVRCTQEIDVPETFMHGGVEHAVQFDVRDNGDYFT